MRHPHLTSFAGLDDQCLTHYFIRVHGRAPTPEELADLRGQGPAPRDGQSLQPPHSTPPPHVAPWRGVRREIAKLIHRL